MNFSLTYYLLTLVEANDLSSLSSLSIASYSMAISPAMVTLLFLGTSGLIMIDTDFLSIIFKLEKLSFCSSSISSLYSLFSDSDSDDDELTCLHLIFKFYTSTLMAAICKLSGEKLPNSFKSLRDLLSWFFWHLEIRYLFVDLAPSHQAQGMVRILTQNFIESIKGSFLVT